MTHEFSPQRLDVTAFAQQAGHLGATTPISQFSRLMAELTTIDRVDDDPYFVKWEASGRLEAVPGSKDRIWLDLHLNACVPQICQRCLTLAALTLPVDLTFRFVASEQQAEQEDETAEEDLLVISKAFDLMELIEDEVLMALPLIPMHDVCPTALPTEAADPDFEEGAPQAHPFSALAALKKK